MKDTCFPHAYSSTHLIAAKVAPWCFIEQIMSLVAPVGISHSCQADLRWQNEQEVSSSSCTACLDTPPPLKKQEVDSCFHSFFINWTGSSLNMLSLKKMSLRRSLKELFYSPWWPWFGLFQRWRNPCLSFQVFSVPTQYESASITLFVRRTSPTSFNWAGSPCVLERMNHKLQ